MKYLDLAIANEQIKTTDIKGKDYAEVNQRIKAFRMCYPDGIINTEMISNENGVCIFKATVGCYVEDEEIGFEPTNIKILGTGTAYEKEDSSFINKTSYIENCETSAVGRALGMAGFGIDVSVASAEEVANAINNQTLTQEEADAYTMTFGKYQGKKIKELPKDYIEWLIYSTKNERLLKIIELTTGIAMPSEEEQKETLELTNKITTLAIQKQVEPETICEKFGVEDIKYMTIEQMKKCVEALEKK